MGKQQIGISGQAYDVLLRRLQGLHAVVASAVAVLGVPRKLAADHRLFPEQSFSLDEVPGGDEASALLLADDLDDHARFDRCRFCHHGFQVRNCINQLHSEVSNFSGVLVCLLPSTCVSAFEKLIFSSLVQKVQL